MRILRGCLLGALISLGACALAPHHSARLDEARLAYDEATGDPAVATLAPAELRRAGETLERAKYARATLNDIAVVDHLAYVAKQEVAIAREVARQRRLAAGAD
jgi:hypothetical protein